MKNAQLRDDALVATGTSTKVIPNTDLREQSEPVNRSNPVGQLASPDGSRTHGGPVGPCEPV